MSALFALTQDLFSIAIAFLKDSPWREEYLLEVERLCADLDKPCVLAVTGRVKAGKSTLINALLGADLALVGTTETTATINFFRYGRPENPARPVKCKWRDGRETWETLQFLNALQGAGAETLQRSESIESLEFFTDNPSLKDITLVDTPGTNAIVGKDDQGHQRVAEEFFRINTRLRERHDTETRHWTRTADAVLCLMGQVAQVNDRDFLQEFQQATCGQTRAMNAVGIIGQIDFTDEIIEHRQKLADSVAAKLSKELNTVVPVSAGLWRALDVLESSGQLHRMQETLRRIPENYFAAMLNRDSIFLSEKLACDVSVEERKQLMAGLPWRVFVVIARGLYTKPVDDVVTELRELSGIGQLKRLLEVHFYQRGKLLRYYRIVSDLGRILRRIQHAHLPEYLAKCRENKRRMVAFGEFIVAHPEGRGETADELRRFLARHAPCDDTRTQEESLLSLLGRFERVEVQLEVISLNFSALQMIEDASANTFSEAERTQLREIFGMYSALESEDTQGAGVFSAQTQLYWQQVQMQSRRNSIRAQVAENAVRAIGNKLTEVL